MQGTSVHAGWGYTKKNSHIYQVFTVDPERRRISLTAKKTLVESELPIITKFEEAKVGMLTHAVIFRISERRLQIEFFNNIKGSVPQKEARLVIIEGFLCP